MADAAAIRRDAVSWLPWAAAVLVAGASAGLAGAAGAVTPKQALAALIAGVVTWLVLWRVEYAPAVIVFTLPLDVAGRVYQGPITVTLFHLALLLSLASWGMRVLQDRKRWLRFSALDAAILGLLFAAVWSLPQSLYPKGTIVSIVRLVFIWLFTLLYANLVRDQADVDRLVGALGITGLATSLLVMVQYKFPEIAPGNTAVIAKIGGEKVTRVSGFFDDPNYLAGFLTVVIVVALAKLVHARRALPAGAWLGLLAASGAALVITLSRTGWVAVLFGIVIVLLTAPKKRRLWLLIATGILGVILVGSASRTIVARFESITDVQTDRSVGTRFLMLESTVEIIHDYWVWGTGLNAFDHAYVKVRKPGSLPDVIRPHQLPLAMWAEMGVAGLVAELGLLAAIAVQFFRRRPRGWTMLEGLALGGVVTLLLQTLFQYYLYFEYLWLFLALCVIARRVAEHEEALYV